LNNPADHPSNQRSEGDGGGISSIFGGGGGGGSGGGADGGGGEGGKLIAFPQGRRDFSFVIYDLLSVLSVLASSADNSLVLGFASAMPGVFQVPIISQSLLFFISVKCGIPEVRCRKLNTWLLSVLLLLPPKIDNCPVDHVRLSKGPECKTASLWKTRGR